MFPHFALKRDPKRVPAFLLISLISRFGWLQEIQLAIITDCKSEWLTLGGALIFGGGPEVVIVEAPSLDDLESLFERNAR